MAILSKLKIVVATRRISGSPQEHRRDKLIDRLEEQLAMAEAFVKGETFTKTRRVYVTGDDGARQLTERQKRLKPWWWHDAAGNFSFAIRYGARVIELQKGRSAVEIGKKENLPAVIQTLIEAVKAGELDDIVAKVAELTGPQFKKNSAA